VCLSVVGVPDSISYEWDSSDLYSICNMFSSVDHVEVDGRFAKVYLSSYEDAERCIEHLNGRRFVLCEHEGRLCVYHEDPLHLQQAAAQRRKSTQSDSPSRCSTAESEIVRGATRSNQRNNDSNRTDAVMEKNVFNARKYTCRFEIKIVNDKYFQVSKRIIGHKGANMRKIYTETGSKLRLRGIGSGYYEGISGSESPEPLHLCISSTSAEGYVCAVKRVMTLLDDVYKQYFAYIDKHGAQRLRTVSEIKRNRSNVSMCAELPRGAFSVLCKYHS